YRPGLELVARSQSDCLVERIKIWTGVCRQSRNRRRHGGPALKQERYSDYGWHFDRSRVELHHAPLGAMEYPHPTRLAFRRCPDRSWLLRRLRKDHSAERRRYWLPRQALGPSRPCFVHRSLS